MRVEVDQSGKIELTQKPTVVAMANGRRYSIRIAAQAKRDVFKELEKRYPTRSPTTHKLLIFATLLYLLLRNHIKTLDTVIVDVEYQGHMSKVKEHLLNLFRRHRIEVAPEVIDYRPIGKKSPAHDLAIKAFRGKVLPDKEVTAEEVLAEFRK